MNTFDVALWRVWPSLWPEWIAMVEAERPFSAIVQVMHTYGLHKIAYGTASVRDRSLCYRVYGLVGVDRGLVWFAGRASRSF
jgi:hypothetical protein